MRLGPGIKRPGGRAGQPSSLAGYLEWEGLSGGPGSGGPGKAGCCAAAALSCRMTVLPSSSLQGGAGVVHLFGLATTPAMFYSIVLSGKG